MNEDAEHLKTPSGSHLLVRARESIERRNLGLDDVGHSTESLFDLSLDLLCVAGTDGYFRKVNPSFGRILGYTEKELLTTPFMEFVHADDRQATRDEIEKLAAGRPTVAFENRYRCKNGSYRWFEWNAMPVPDEGAVYAVARDLTDLKQQELIAHRVVQCAPVAMILIDPKGEITLTNQHIQTVFGYRQDELTGQSPLVLIPERFHREYDRFRAVFAERPEKRQLGARQTIYGLHKDGSEVPVELAVGPVDLGGPHLLVTVSDITRRVKTEEERCSLTRDLVVTRSALDEAAIVSVADHEGRIRVANHRLCQISGYSREELLGQSYRLLNSGYHPDDFFRDLWRTITSGQVWRGEMCNRAKDGTSFWLDMTIVPVRDAEGRPEEYRCISFDATARKESEALQSRLYHAVEQAADPVFITDREGVIEYVNPAFEATTGYTAEEALGHTPRILKSGKQDQSYYEGLWKEILAGEVHRSAPVNRKKNGELYHAEQTITPIRDPSGRFTHFVSVVKDMTERRRAEEQRIEMEVAGEIQQKFYPRAAPRLKGIDLAGTVVPAVQACGDYFDYIPMANGTLGIVVGDMTGHGFGPALMMAETRAYLRALALTLADPCKILTIMNRALAEDLEDRHFASVLLAQLDSSARKLSYVNAGHFPGYVLDRTGGVKAVLESTGTPLGMFEERAYEDCRDIELEPGDVAILSTDGLTESSHEDDEEFGAERLLETARGCLDQDAEGISRCLLDAAREFAAGTVQRDDITLVVCKVDQAGES